MSHKILYVRTPSPGACNYSIYPCLSVFTDQSIFSLDLLRIQIPRGSWVTNCNHKHGQVLTCRHDVVMITWGRIVLTLPKRAHVYWNWPISLEKISKNRLVFKNAVALAYYGSCKLLVMDSSLCLILVFFFLFRRPSQGRVCPGQRLPKHLYSWCAWEPGPLTINGTAPAACLAVAYWILLNFY